MIEFTADGEPIVPNVLWDWRAEMQRERDVNAPGTGHNLRNYWVRGKGAAKIGWGTDGSFARCVSHLEKYVKNPQGLCAEYHKAATGEWPAEKGVESHGETVYASTEGGDDTVETITAADKTPYGDVKYADPGYQDDGVKRYPIDTEAHIRAAWSYINMPKNAAKYSSQELRRVKARIERAMKDIGADVTAATAVAMDIAEVIGEVNDTAPDIQVGEQNTAGDAPWNGVLTVEGIESGDGRMFGANSLSWDEPPLPLMWQKETSHGGSNDVSVRVGSIDKIWREPDPSGRADVFVIRGEGRIDLGNPDGAEVHRRMKANHLRGNSVDVDSVKETDIELSYPEVTAEVDGANPLQAMFASPDLTTYKRGRIRATTLVEIPAFTEARLQLSDAVTASAEDCVECEETRQALDALTAATSVIEIPDLPPREWFAEPTDVSPVGALTVTNEGRVYGYVAPAGVRHRSFHNKSVYVPLRNVDYGNFMGGETLVADGGRVSTGNITMGCGHATTKMKLTPDQAAEHYDNTCSIVATARVGENEHGVWIAGALLPDVDASAVRRMMACRLSGDWRTHLDRPGWREFVAALLVPVPGFPMARVASSVQISEGELVASSVPVRLETAAGVVTHATLRQERVSAAAQRVAVLRKADRVASLRARAFHGTHNQKSHGNRRGGGSLVDVTDSDWDNLYTNAANQPNGTVLMQAVDDEHPIRLVKKSGTTARDTVIDLEEKNLETDRWVVSSEDVAVEDIYTDLPWKKTP